MQMRGTLLLLASVATFLGTTMEVLPFQAFWLALALGPVGGWLFFRGSREALAHAERRAGRKVKARIANRADAYAEQQAAGRLGLGSAHFEREQRSERAVAANQVFGDEILLAEEADLDEGDFAVSEDVSFPIELQESAAISQQIERLQRLLESGIIDEHEFAAAKAKILA